MLEKRGVLLSVEAEQKQLNLSGDNYHYHERLVLGAHWCGKNVLIKIDDTNSVVSCQLLETKEVEVKGKIQSINLTIPRISMHAQGALKHFYIPMHQLQTFKQAFKAGDYINFLCNETCVELQGGTYYVMTALQLDKVKPKQKNPMKLKKEVLEQLELIQTSSYYAFLDLEFTMSGSEFKEVKFMPEILQFGIIIMNQEGAIVEKFSSYVKPTKFKHLSSLTQDFLKIDNDRLKYAMSYLEFYDCMKMIKARYQPIFLVWGVSDAYILQSSYLINEVSPVLQSTDLLDLQRLHRQYFAVSQDIGLFNALRAYEMEAGLQIHDAMIDALVLSRIFFKFKAILKEEIAYPFKQRYMQLVNPALTASVSESSHKKGKKSSKYYAKQSVKKAD